MIKTQAGRIINSSVWSRNSWCLTGKIIFKNNRFLNNLSILEINVTDNINKKNYTTETAACCCVDVGAIIDNSDCVAYYSGVFNHPQQAKDKLTELSAKARKIESEPCLIRSSMTEQPDGSYLEASFQFSCQAETLIFQLGLR